MSQPYFDPDAGADHAGALLERVRDALARRAPLRIVGGDSKAFLGRPVAGEPLALAEHRGIVAYDPCELVITARAGTPLDELQAVLARGGQMLACEAPGFGGRATVGGVLASGLSGPRRPWAGAVRDFVLGTRLISGLGTHLRFGGEVMKNVAGYDLSRLLAGSFGCLGVVTEVSFKVLPMPRCQAGLSLDLPVATALRKLAEWEASHCRSVRPATTAKPCACAWRAARARYARRATASVAKRSRTASGPTCASSACRSSTTRDRSGACRCRRWRRRRRCPVVSCWTGAGRCAG